MKIILPIGFLLSLILLSCNGLGPIDDSILKAVETIPNDSLLIGEWEINSDSYDMIKEKYKNYHGEKVSIVFYKNHRFKAFNIPDCVTDAFGDPVKGKFHQAEGRWEVVKRSDRCALSMEFDAGKLYEHGVGTTYDLFRKDSSLVFITFIGDPDSSDKLYFTKKPSVSVKKKKLGEEKAFDLSVLPKDWVRLTSTDSGLVVFNSCDGGNLLVSILKNNNSYKLLLHGTQEDDEFDILETTIGANDTVFFKAEWINSDEKQDFKFVWRDKEKKQAHWITTFSSGFTMNFIFVAGDQQTNYPKIDQPCKECWGEECDELQKLEK